MQPLPKDYKFIEIERKWQQKWEDLGVFRYDWNDTKRVPFSIDTPPPYPSGELHMGNVLNWTYFDMVARYKRMRGFNVLFPQGWDCHGLGIEIQVEKLHDVRKRDVEPAQFRSWCQELVEKYIGMMKDGILKLGCSIDWSTEYRTMDPDYWRRTQLSFILLHKKGYMYRGTHPVNWCPRCETAIADAEVDYKTRESTLNYIRYPLEDSSEHLLIATSRPEFIPACVAVEVNPKDERFNKYIGKNIIVPIVNRKVPIIAEESVDPDFGTGVVQICTYGDKEDVKTVMKHKLPTIGLLSENGRISESGDKYAGLTVSQARAAIVEDLKAQGLLEKVEPLTQQVGKCDRCKANVEILERKQWFMKTRSLTEQVEKTANEVIWYPDYMKSRLIDWAKALDWDWVISRQRLFATPIPVWYCKSCGELILAGPDWVPINPKLENPKIEKCPKCGGTDFNGETDVFDTWMDSSITCAVHAGWPDREDWTRLFPADMHPSGIDIIRTWAYYLMVRHLALFDQTPYKSCLINGMVLGGDGRKMSKSLKNYVAAPKVLDQYGADATRQWAAGGGATGSDIPYRAPDVEYGRRFLVKLWNVSGFTSKLLADYTPTAAADVKLEPLDRWVLSKMQTLIQNVTDAFEKCQFNMAVEELRNFTWHVFCDSYVEAVKDRLYRPEVHGQEKRVAAQYTLYSVLYHMLQLLSPVTPHLTEEIYQTMYAPDKNYSSLQTSPWPQVEAALVDEQAEKQGALVVELIGEVRREKAQNRLSLNTPVLQLKVYAGSDEAAKALLSAESDIVGACKVEAFEVVAAEGEGRELAQYPKVHFVAQHGEAKKK
ncbi:MAG: valine--tRNA ligase [Candidatus Bathyarchaeota archaeon]|nr:valine--tRNA ligase [Candidatus Bathyarchaeota archaeon]